MEASFLKRIYLLLFLLILSFFIVIARAIFIQRFEYDFFSFKAKKQYNVPIKLFSKRGSILDRRQRILAFDLPSYSLYAEPRMMSLEEKERAASMLANILNLDEDYILKRLNKDKAFVWIARRLPLDLKMKVDSLGIKGLGYRTEFARAYPDNKLMCQALGFTNVDRNGISGIELFYDEFLSGLDGVQWLIKDGRQVKMPIGTELVQPRDGLSIELTVDEVIQDITENALRHLVEKYHPDACWAVVMDPFTGEVLAMANWPGFDLNEYSKASDDQMRNRAITDMFEPGSVFKIITATAAIEEGIMDEETEVYCENGAYRVLSHTLHDHHPYKTLTFREVIEKSSNIGTVKVAQKLGKEKLYSYIRKFGFGKKTGIDLPGEVAGSIKPPDKWSGISIAAVPMGQEVGVTSIQLARAVSVIANGGYLVKPYLCAKFLDKDGSVLKNLSSYKKRERIISQDTAERVKEILTGVVERGTGRRAQIKGYRVAGKTGTAQEIVNGKYSNTEFMSSFVGFVPADSPQFVICVTADTRKPFHFGGVVAAPAFREIAEKSLKYLGIAPSKTNEKQAMPQ